MFRAKLRTLVCKPPVNCSVTHKPLDNKNNGTCYDCYQFVIKRLIEIAETRINTGFFKQLDLFKLANKSLLLYIFVSVLWFYLVLYVFHCPKSIDCTERCYQFVITSLLSIKDSRDILISVNYTINLYIFVTDLVDNNIIFPYRIFIICPKADPFGEI